MSSRIGQQLGNYRLTRLLGRGGFAEVYLGEHIRLKTPAAIKILHTYMADQELQNFEREAQIIAGLRHPHIVSIFDFDVQNGLPFLVMDYAPNGSLVRLHPRGTVLPILTVTGYIQQITEALQYAHDQQFIHRDIKPENILLGRQNELLLSDFGIATISHNTTSLSAQTIAGTTPYMAPEQMHGRAGVASDQYALGIIAYEWLCGTRPFTGTAMEIAMQHNFAAPTPLRQHNPTIPPHIEQVILTALAKNPQQRFARVSAFANALRNALVDAQRGRPVPNSDSSLNLTSTYIAVSPSDSSFRPSSVPPTRLAAQPTPASSPPTVLPGDFSTPNRDAAYESLCAKIQTDLSSRSQALIIRADDTQVGQAVYVVEEQKWIKVSSDDIVRYAKATKIKPYQINGQTIAAAIFNALSAGDYMVWTDIKKPISVTANKGNAILVNLQCIQSIIWPDTQKEFLKQARQTASKKSAVFVENSNNIIISTENEASILNEDEAYESLCVVVQKDLNRRYQALVIRADDTQVGQAVYVVEEQKWIKVSSDDIVRYAQAAYVKHYTINGWTIAAAIFNSLYDYDYTVWIDINQLKSIGASKGEVIIVDMRGQA